MMHKIFLAIAVGLTFVPSASAGITAVPEPGTFELLALGGVVALVIGIRNRRGKKK
jgi:hypothetical protein